MNILHDIQARIHYITFYNEEPPIKPKYLIIHPETERKIFIEELLAKNLDLGEELNIKVILSKEVEIDEIIIGT